MMNREKARQYVFDLIEGNLVWAVGESFGRVFVNFHENAIDSGCDSASSQNGSKLAVAPGCSSESSGTLDGVGSIENDWNSFLSHPWQGSHISDEVVVSEGGASLCNCELITVEVPELP